MIRAHADLAQGSLDGGSQSSANAPDRLLEEAIEAGYFPELAAGRIGDTTYADAPDVGVLFEAIDREVRGGKPTYSSENENERDDDWARGAADELAQILDQAGLDAAKATDAQIAKAVTAYRQAAEDALYQGLFDDPAQPNRSMTEAQRAEMEARQKQQMARRGGQASVKDQAGGLFSSERDQRTLFQGRAPPPEGSALRAFYQNSATLAGHNPQSRYMIAHETDNPPRQAAEEIDAGGSRRRSGAVGDIPGPRARDSGLAEEQRLLPGLGLAAESIGAFIEVDGTDRPTANANGEQIASSADALRNFWRWFGDSKLVDKQGRPLVFYHGTRADLDSAGMREFAFDPNMANGGTFFFAIDRSTAEEFAKDGNVIAAYLAADDIDTYDAEDQSWSDVVPVDPDEVTSAVEAWLADEMRDFETAWEVIEVNDGWEVRHPDGSLIFNGEHAKYGTYKVHDRAVEALDQAADDERGQKESELRDDPPYPHELVNLGYLESTGKSTDDLAQEAMGYRQAVYIENVDEGVGSTNVAIILGLPTRIKSTDNSGAFDPDDPRIHYQTFADGPRGQISFPAAGFGTGPSVIDLFQARDASTFVHEFGHQRLEELRFDAEGPDATDQLRADWQAVKDWFKANGHPVGKDGAIPREAHELFARGWERFLMEGKSPSVGLRRVFERFKALMLTIYQVVDNLNAPITPEIREVMQRGVQGVAPAHASPWRGDVLPARAWATRSISRPRSAIRTAARISATPMRRSPPTRSRGFSARWGAMSCSLPAPTNMGSRWRGRRATSSGPSANWRMRCRPISRLCATT